MALEDDLIVEITVENIMALVYDLNNKGN